MINVTVTSTAAVWDVPRGATLLFLPFTDHFLCLWGCVLIFNAQELNLAAEIMFSGFLSRFIWPDGFVTQMNYGYVWRPRTLDEWRFMESRFCQRAMKCAQNMSVISTGREEISACKA